MPFNSNSHSTPIWQYNYYHRHFIDENVESKHLTSITPPRGRSGMGTNMFLTPKPLIMIVL